jgi:hypothetical protein
MSGFDRPLPAPLARFRALRIHRARRLGRARRGKTATVDGFELMLPAGVDAPVVVGTSHPDSFLGRHLDVRGGERVLVAPAGSGILALHAARVGADVTILGGTADAVGLERSFRLAGFGAPSAVAGLDGDDFDAIILGEGHDPVDLAALAENLGRGGRLLMAASDRDSEDLRAELARSGLRWTTLFLERDGVFGTRRVLRAWRAVDAPGGYVAGGASLPGAGWVLRDR